MRNKNFIVKCFDFLVYLYSNLLPDMGGFMKPIPYATFYLDMQITLPLFLIKKIFPNLNINNSIPLITFFILWLPIYFFIKWRNKKNHEIYKNYKIFHLPILVRGILLFLIVNAPIILLLLILRSMS